MVLLAVPEVRLRALAGSVSGEDGSMSVAAGSGGPQEGFRPSCRTRCPQGRMFRNWDRQSRSQLRALLPEWIRVRLPGSQEEGQEAGFEGLLRWELKPAAVQQK